MRIAFLVSALCGCINFAPVLPGCRSNADCGAGSSCSSEGLCVIGLTGQAGEGGDTGSAGSSGDGGMDGDTGASSDTGASGDTGASSGTGAPVLTSRAITGKPDGLVRQGFGEAPTSSLVEVVALGSHLDGATSVSFGDARVVAAIVSATASSLTINATVKHGATPGEKILTVTAPSGVATLPSALTVTEIRSEASGNDSTGDGTTARPFRSLAKALSVAASGDTVRLGAGTFGVSTEAYPQLSTPDPLSPVTPNVPSGVTLVGAGPSSTVLQGFGSGSTTDDLRVALVLSSGSVAQLLVTGFRVGIVASGGSNAVSDVHLSSNTVAGLVATSDVALTNVESDTNDHGVQLASGAGATLIGCHLHDNTTNGLRASTLGAVAVSGSTITANGGSALFVSGVTGENGQLVASNLGDVTIRGSTLSGTPAGGGAQHGLYLNSPLSETIVDISSSQILDQGAYAIFAVGWNALTVRGSLLRSRNVTSAELISFFGTGPAMPTLTWDFGSPMNMNAANTFLIACDGGAVFRDARTTVEAAGDGPRIHLDTSATVTRQADGNFCPAATPVSLPAPGTYDDTGAISGFILRQTASGGPPRIEVVP